VRKAILITIAIILWLIAVTPLTVTLLSNVDEVKIVDLAAIKSEQIIIGTNEWLNPDFNCLVSDLMGKPYELVMVGVTELGKIIYLGKTAKNEWYGAEENLDVGFIQKVKKAEIDDKGDLAVYYSKNFSPIIAITIISIVVLGAIGLVIFFEAFKQKKN